VSGGRGAVLKFELERPGFTHFHLNPTLVRVQTVVRYNYLRASPPMRRKRKLQRINGAYRWSSRQHLAGSHCDLRMWCGTNAGSGESRGITVAHLTKDGDNVCTVLSSGAPLELSCLSMLYNCSSTQRLRLHKHKIQFRHLHGD
jgi:hypothetical protein